MDPAQDDILVAFVAQGRETSVEMDHVSAVRQATHRCKLPLISLDYISVFST